MMNTSKIALKLFFCIAVLFCSSCDSSATKNTKLPTKPFGIKDASKIIIGEWKLVQESSDGSSDIIFTVSKDGKFNLKTVLNDPVYKEAGINQMQAISQGEWTLKGEKLILTHHSQDEKIDEEFTVVHCEASDLQLRNKINTVHAYVPYTEK